MGKRLIPPEPANVQEIALREALPASRAGQALAAAALRRSGWRKPSATDIADGFEITGFFLARRASRRL